MTRERKRLSKDLKKAIVDQIPPGLVSLESGSDTFVYFIQFGTAVKIGFSKDVRRRAADLQTAQAYIAWIRYVIRGGAKMEWYFHNRFKKWKIRGELFEFSQEIQDFLKATPYEAPETIERPGRVLF